MINQRVGAEHETEAQAARLGTGLSHVYCGGMKKKRQFTAVLERERDGYVALCPELDVASQGDTVEQALANLREAVELFLECASPQELAERLHDEVFVTRFEAVHA